MGKQIRRSLQHQIPQSKQSGTQRVVRRYLVFLLEVIVGLAIAAALLALAYYLTDPQVLILQDWFS